MQIKDRPGIGDAMLLQIIAGALLQNNDKLETIERAAAHGWLMSQVRCDVSPFRLSEIDQVWQATDVVTKR